MCRIHPSVHSLNTDILRFAQAGHREEQQGGWTSQETSFVSLPAPNLLLLRTGPLPTPSALGTSCLMERELAPGKTMNFNASGHSNQTEACLPGKASRGFRILWPNPHLVT